MMYKSLRHVNNMVVYIRRNPDTVESVSYKKNDLLCNPTDNNFVLTAETEFSQKSCTGEKLKIIFRFNTRKGLEKRFCCILL